MKKILLSVLCALIIVCTVMAIRSTQYSQTEFMLNTVIKITAESKDKEAVRECFSEIRRIENLLSVYLPDSEISKLNSAPCGKAVKLDSEVFELLKRAEELKKITDGAFDITLKPIVDLWNIQGGGYVPTDDEIKEAQSLTGNLIFDDSAMTVTLPEAGMAVDLGGIAKGYAGDRVREILISRGVKSAIADLGGNIVTIGKKGRQGWFIGLQNPLKPRGTVFANINVSDKFVVTSGGYERFFEKDGQAYHHIFDPATGKNPENNILSVTIISGDGTLADALSTACFVAGEEKAVKIAEGCSADIVIYTTEGIYSSSGIALSEK